MRREDGEASSPGATVAAVLTIPYVMWAYGFALQKIWLWTLVPMGIPAVSRGAAYALAIMVGLVTFRPRRSERCGWDLVWQAVVAPWFALGLAWLALRFP